MENHNDLYDPLRSADGTAGLVLGLFTNGRLPTRDVDDGGSRWAVDRGGGIGRRP